MHTASVVAVLLGEFKLDSLTVLSSTIKWIMSLAGLHSSYVPSYPTYHTLTSALAVSLFSTSNQYNFSERSLVFGFETLTH